MSKKLLSVIALTTVIAISNSIAQQVPNSSFDSTWTHTAGPPAYDDPAAWATPNILTTDATIFGAQQPCVFKDSLANAHSGKYAMKIVTTKYTPGGIAGSALAAYLPNGTFDFAFTGSIVLTTTVAVVRGYADTHRYGQLDFFAKYTPVGSDVATCGVMLSKWTGTKRDTVAKGLVTMNSTATYTDFTIPLTYVNNTLTPDTAVVVFSSSGTTAQAQLGSILWVDDVLLSGTVPLGVENYSSLMSSIKTYPNPASENITLALTDNNNQNLSLIEIFDVTGRKADEVIVQNNQAVINTASFAKGLYLYSAYNEKKELIGVGKFNVLH
jgi:hypothetical protein